MTGTNDLPRFSLNALTGAPLLRLLLAIRGEEPPSLDAEVAWQVFKQFARIPTDQSHDLVSFQATWRPEDTEDQPDPPIFYVTWARELTASAGSITRAVQLQWCFDPASETLDEIELWSDAYPDLDGFFGAIETSPEFRSLMTTPSTVELYAAELDE